MTSETKSLNRETSPPKWSCPPITSVKLWGKIFFDSESSQIKEVSVAVLDDIVDILKHHPEVELIEVQGYTDNTGSKEENIQIGLARAKMARDYLVAHGVDPTRLVVKSYGSSNPMESNQTKYGRSCNRRCEFVILKQPSVVRCRGIVP